MNQIVEEIKRLFFQSQIPVFGIARSSSLEDEPSGYRPSDMLPSAESILCCGIPVPKGIFKSGERSAWMYWRAANIYYRNIDMVLNRACSTIEEKGEVAVPVYGCFPYDIKGKGDFWGYLSLVRMSEAVGIGKIGKNGLLFNSKYGPRLILGGIVTTAKLPSKAWPKKDVKRCPENCFVCQEQCPAGAIDKTGKVNGPLCTKYSSKSPMFSYFMKKGENSAEDIKMLNHLTAVDDHSMYQCIKCVSVCPYM
ncbi:MAG: epoxyqueuosine reductase [Deltaproteobacteria bacterium]|nr:epoxyqueuosine reductase [Deltaproteobacteria bacterium]